MKSIIFIFAVLFSTLAFSQEYLFDHKCSYLETQLKGIYPDIKPRKKAFLFNSKDSRFIMWNYNISQNVSLLYDYKASLARVLKDSSYQNKTVLQEMRSFDFTKHKDEIKIKNINVQSIGENEFLIEIFEKRRSNKPRLSIKMKLKPADHPLVRLQFMDVTYNIHHKVYEALLPKLNGINYQFEKITVNNDDVVITSIEFNPCEKINTKYVL